MTSTRCSPLQRTSSISVETVWSPSPVRPENPVRAFGGAESWLGESDMVVNEARQGA
jgi:hypothetical protein